MYFNKELEEEVFGEYGKLYAEMFPIDVIEKDHDTVMSQIRDGYVSYPQQKEDTWLRPVRMG